MTVHFIGAGPGAPDLITVRGLTLLRRCPVVLYAGSLVPPMILAEAPAGARIVDTAPLDLDAIMAEMEQAAAEATRSRGCIPAIPPSMAPSPSRCAASTGSASPTT